MLKVKLVFGVFEFFRRQMKTKTGNTAIVAILTAWYNYFNGTLVPDGSEQWAIRAAIAATFLGLIKMYQRDGQAKLEAAERKAAGRLAPDWRKRREERERAERHKPMGPV
jgi:hypothetical protein